jgi:adenosine deaminase
MPELRAFVRGLPKAELHLHIEGSLEPEMLLALAAKHRVKLEFSSVEELRKAYEFDDLQSFLDIYYQGAAVLRDAEDFHALTFAYLEKAHADGVVHAEIFCDPQTHTPRGVPMREVLEGISKALEQGVPLTVCPLSNVKLKVFRRLQDHNLKRLLDAGLRVTVNSDDPAYFGGYVLDNYVECAAALGLSRAELAQLCANSISASLLPDARKTVFLERIRSASA